VTDVPGDERPPGVAGGPAQGGEVRARWAWAEPSVWTDRMLTALEVGAKGGKWFSLIDKVYAPKNLESSWDKVRRNQGAAGVDGQSVMKFGSQAAKYLGELHDALKEGDYRPQEVLRCWIPKPGSDAMRPLGIPVVKDRVVQGALRNVMEPIFERLFVEHSYGFRPGRSCMGALRRVDELLKAGYTWVVDADIRSYFDTIDHEILMAEVEKEVADGKVLALLRSYLNQKVMDGARIWKPAAGTPQGAVISPLLANIYLHPVDLALQRAGCEMVRYADDLVILSKSEGEALQALELLRAELGARKLELHPEKTRIVDATQPGGFEFLGYRFGQGRRWPRRKSEKAFRDKIRAKTKRTSGKSLLSIIQEINPIVRGWFYYFKHAYKTTFSSLDGWVRMRLRSILRKRTKKRRGRGRGKDHQRWPNAYFRDLGLFTMQAAHASLCQSRCGNH
jgi:RNA-directed DNA polymerase